jgi:hypothetical protein
LVQWKTIDGKEHHNEDKISLSPNVQMKEKKKKKGGKEDFKNYPPLVMALIGCEVITLSLRS